MGQRGRPTPTIELSDTERETLQRWVRRHSSAQALAQRSRIVLACAEGATNGEVAADERVHPATVGKWRRRFAADGLEGLCDAPRPGAERTIADETIEALIVDTLESTPGADTHWSTRGLAAKHGISHTTVGEIWRAFGLKPWRQDSFKVSPDPDLVEKIRDLVALYMSPPVAAAVFAIDEKPQIQALNRTAPTLPMLPTTPQRATHDYERNGTTSLFAGLDVATGKVIGECHRRHRHQEFLKFLALVDSKIPPDLEVHLVMDNYGTHKTPKVIRWFARHSRYHMHFTPTSASWLNQVERWFAELTEKRIRRGSFDGVRSLEKAIMEYLEHKNKDPKPFVWTADADLILGKVQRLCERISDSGH